MSVSNTLIAIDAASGMLNSYIKIKNLLDQAAIEGRDNITVDELKNLMAETDKLEDQILNSTHESSK